MKLLPLVFLGACFDYDLKGDEEPPFDDGDPDTGTVPDTDTDTTVPDELCPTEDFPPEECGVTDECHYEIGGFTPIIEWETEGEGSLALPVVADLDGDGMPEIIANFANVFTPGDLAVYHGDGS